MSHRRGLSLTVALIAALASIGPAAAQKQGGTLRSYIWDNPPSASIHEEATISTVFPFMPVFNNLVVFDQTKLEASLDTIVPDLALSWTWDARQDAAHLQARRGRQVARRQAVHGQGRQVHVRSGRRARRLRGLPQEPAQGLVSQRRGDHDQRRPRGLLPAQGAAALLPGPARLRLLADLSLPRVAARHARQAGRHRPVQGRRVQAQRVGLAGAQSRLLEEGPAAARRHRVPGDRQPLDPRAGLHGRRDRSDVRVRHHGRRAQGHHRQGAECQMPVRAVEQHDQHDRQCRRAAVRQARDPQGHGAGARPAAPSTPSWPKASR